ncbi:MAG: glucosidase, partial [Candidatus Nitrotoga sp.]
MTTASAPRKLHPKKQSSQNAPLCKEKKRLIAREKEEPEWSRWGPYVSERQWGTVREDYSPHGEAWEYFSHDHARSRAYRWGEDGIAGISDKFQHLCLGLALWNGRDPILKERLFGLTNSEGNHGEDVKELYYYLDATPTHSYLKMLYKYPQQAYPYAWLVEENGRRGKDMPEFELIDTGTFADDRYFDVFVEYAKADPHDILMRVTAHNRGPDDAPLHILPQLWFRNEWVWDGQIEKPEISIFGQDAIVLQHKKLGTYYCHFDGATELLFCDNETNVQRLYGTENKGYFKDAFHEYVVHGNPHAVNPLQSGTKAAGHFVFTIPAHGKIEVRLRFTRAEHTQPFKDFDSIF